LLGRDSALARALSKTRQVFSGRLRSLLSGGHVSSETWESLEELLIEADVGPAIAAEFVEALRERVMRGELRGDSLQAALEESMVRVLRAEERRADEEPRLLTVVLVVGVNGSGKTTTVGKLARYYTLRGHKVLIAAADTFRAAAIEQLRIWADRAGVPVVAHQPGADPGAVVYDAIRACRARGHNLLLVDTAGRLHTRYNLMAELRKVAEVARRNVHRAPHEVFLVLDATTGQNGMAQARSFREAVGLTGVILAKLDGTAKGGVAFSIARELGVPVRFVGTGEGLEDLVEFDPAAYVAGLFERR